MINSDFIGNLATTTWYELGMPSQISVQSISGYFCNSSAIGQLNNLTANCWQPTGFTGVGSYNYDVYNPNASDSGLLTANEGTLLTLMYKIVYYDRLVNSLIGPGSFSIASGTNNQNLPVTVLKDGDSVIQYMNPAQAAMVYEGRRNEAVKELRFAANVYNINGQGSQTPRTVNWYSFRPGSFGGPWY